MKLLIVEDEKKTGEYLTKGLTEAGFVVDLADNGLNGYHLAMTGDYDLIILDIMLPDVNGWDIVRMLRSANKGMPILLLTALGTIEHRVKGLELGADDYVVKPFSPRELMLRISAIMKRGPLLDSMRQRSIEQDGIYIDLIARRVMVDGNQVSLTPKEFDVLALLAANPDVVVSRKKILDTVWGGDLPEDTRTLDTHIKQVRRAITPYSDRIVTLRGVGYRFEKIMGRIRADHQKPCAARLLMACFCSGPPQGNTGDCALRAGRRLAAPPPRDTHCEAGLSVVQ